MPSAPLPAGRRLKRRKILPAEESTAHTAEYWDLVHGKGRVAYFVSTRELHELLKPILKQSPEDAAVQLLLEDAHEAALAPIAFKECMQTDKLVAKQQQQQQKRRRRIADPLAPLSQTLLELMCGSRPTHVGVASPRCLHAVGSLSAIPWLLEAANNEEAERLPFALLLSLQMRPLEAGAVATYVGIDASYRALQLAREACQKRASSRSAAAAAAAGTAGAAVAAACSCPKAAMAAASAGEEEGSCCRCCMHEAAGRCIFLHRDCRMLSEELPLLQCRLALLVAGLDDIIARSTTDNADCQGPCDEGVLQVLHSAAHALPVGGRLLLVEPTKHAPELLLSLYKALQHPSLCCRFLLYEGGALVGRAKELLFVRFRRHRDAAECLKALDSLHADVVIKRGGKKLLPRGPPGALETPQSVQQSVPLALRLALIQQARELALLLVHPPLCLTVFASLSVYLPLFVCLCLPVYLSLPFLPVGLSVSACLPLSLCFSLCMPLSLCPSKPANTKRLLCMQACREGDLLAATKLLALGADPNYTSSNSSSSSSSSSKQETSMASPLHAAVASGAPQLVNLLLQHGAAASGGPLSLAAELLLQEAAAAGLSLPDELKSPPATAGAAAAAAAPATVPAAAAAPQQQELMRGIAVLSWVEEALETAARGLSCGCCSKETDFLLRAAAVPPAACLTWPCPEPLEAVAGWER
ncbi:hypothetical protein Efla_004524 [Eimeria flavescens]